MRGLVRAGIDEAAPFGGQARSVTRARSPRPSRGTMIFAGWRESGPCESSVTRMTGRRKRPGDARLLDRELEQERARLHSTIGGTARAVTVTVPLDRADPDERRQSYDDGGGGQPEELRDAEDPADDARDQAERRSSGGRGL